MNRWVTLFALVLAAAATAAHAVDGTPWQDRLLAVPYAVASHPDHLMLELVRQDYEALERNRSILKTPLVIGSRTFQRGLGTHAVSRIRLFAPEPIARLSAWIGVDKNERTAAGQGSVVFAVAADGKEVFRSGTFAGGQEGQHVDVATGGARTLELAVDDAGDGPACDHANWAEARVTTASGAVFPLDEIKLGCLPAHFAKYPFSFTYGGRSSDELLPAWEQVEQTSQLDSDRTKRTVVWTDVKTGLRVQWDAVRYDDFPAVEWILHFENAGSAATPILENIQAMDLTVSTPLSPHVPYVLHRAKGGVPNPSHVMPKSSVVDEKRPSSLGSETGRSSTKNMPFFRLDAGGEAYVAAIGWSGCWKADFAAHDGKRLRMTAGMETTHFLLHPGEKVRSPRILLLRWEGDAAESNAQFRQLIYKHYAARRNGQPPLPTIFCNTCFTRGGGWLNECNAENQISLIHAYAPLGLEALLTDAGWFTGGWPGGAGNWDARQDAYPDGMGPVAKAALDKGLIYGLWYEPERVMAGTGIHQAHPEWCLRSGPGPQDTYLLDFGLPEVQQYFFDIVKGYMNLPGFRVYRQDFNMDPLPYWRYNDPPDRQGITELKYIEGLYAYWDRIATTWPDSLMEECASGGHRIDLETVMRMHIHQKTDYWFDDQTDQTAIFGLSQFLPNNVIVAHLNNLDTYSFHSTMASSLCLGWIADAPDFDARRGKQLIDRYKQVRHLLVGGWYPLLTCPNDYVDLNTRDADLWLWGDASKHRKPHTEWVATQYHRPDLGEGMVLAFRRPDSPYASVQVSLRGIEPAATYEVSWDSRGPGDTKLMPGSNLSGGFEIFLPKKRSSDLIVYRKVKNPPVSE
jgi:alpha-galactosidase